MTRILIGFIALFASFSPAFADQTTKDVNIAVNDVYVPSNLRAGDEAKIVLSGILPNGCYRYDRAVVRSVDFIHEIKAIAKVQTNSLCLMVLVPFAKEVNLGPLDAGVHTLRFISGDDTFFEKTLTVH
ncbi:MAG: hypothetical protein KF767_18470 [Bdellovibrionaceae bacterium]|nr:hypothetical protein [Pseudobdellovibrionaceae bacterium]